MKTSSRSWALALCCFSALFAACGSSNPPPPDPTPDDAQVSDGNLDAATSTRSDASVGDAGSADGGVITDDCNPLEQTGCNDPTLSKCTVESSAPRGGTECVEPGVTEKSLGQQCTGGECLPGLVCVNTSTAPLCHKVCNPDTGAGCEALGANWDCALRLRDTNWGACQELGPTCDPLTQMPCDPNQACQFVQRVGGAFELRCQTAGTGMDGAACGGANPRCARTFVCVRESGVSNCRKFCGTNADCTAPQECTGSVQGASYCR